MQSFCIRIKVPYYPKAADIWLEMCLCFVICVLIEFAIIHHINNQKSDKHSADQDFNDVQLKSLPKHANCKDEVHSKKDKHTFR